MGHITPACLPHNSHHLPTVPDLAVAQKVVARSGSWFKYGDSHLGQGKEKARAFLIENPEVTEEIKDKVMAAGGFGLDAIEPASEEQAE